MSLESSISELAAAMNALAQAITKVPAGALAGKPKAANAQAEAAIPARGQPTATAEVADAPEKKAIDFAKDIVPLFLGILKAPAGGESVGQSIIDHFKKGEKRLSVAVTPEQYPELLAMLEKITKELEAV